MTRHLFSFRSLILAALTMAAAILLLALPVGFTPGGAGAVF
ncbi:MAG: hypothetical protein R3D52_05025 [Xanthobacteraceae bacterium]